MRKIDFHILLDEYKSGVYSYACYLLKNREDAEDVTQDVFIRLWNNRASVRHSTQKAWIMKVAHNRCMDLLRQKKAAISREKIHVPVIPDLIRDEDPSANPEASLDAQHIRESIRDAMDLLPDRTRSIMIMHYFQGMKYKDISAALETSESAVKITIYRGKKILKNALAGLCKEQFQGCLNE